MMPPYAKSAPEAVTKSLWRDCSKLECKWLACNEELKAMLRLLLCVNLNCENPYNEVKVASEEDDNCESDSETENF